MPEAIEDIMHAGAGVEKSTSASELQILIDSGLIRQSFIERATQDVLNAALEFASDYCHHNQGNNTRGKFFVENKLLPEGFAENYILNSLDPNPRSNDFRIRHRVVARHLGVEVSDAIMDLWCQDKLDASLVHYIFKNNILLFDNESVFKRLGHIVVAGHANCINFGITRILEFEAACKGALGYTPSTLRRLDNILQEPNPILRVVRANERLDEKRAQIEKVIDAGDRRSVGDQLRAIWDYYSAQSDVFRRISREPVVEPTEQCEHLRSVNDYQSQFGFKVAQPEKRFLNIYARYNLAEMDSFMLAMIVLTAGWYIDNRHARLFTGIRLIPDRFPGIRELPRRIYGERVAPDSIPWVALAAYPRLRILKVMGDKFKQSFLGANCMFLTHSNAHEATNSGSIPILGIATLMNENKFDKNMPYAALAADFDATDSDRVITRRWRGPDHAASIAGIIGATLTAIRQVEDLEIGRAGGENLEFVRGKWGVSKPSRAKSVKPPSPAVG